MTSILMWGCSNGAAANPTPSAGDPEGAALDLSADAAMPPSSDSDAAPSVPDAGTDDAETVGDGSNGTDASEATICGDADGHVCSPPPFTTPTAGLSYRTGCTVSCTLAGACNACRCLGIDNSSAWDCY
ncbi:MAG TPA: hypothetical protein VGM06_08540 [Polyangiaceae bacterium]